MTEDFEAAAAAEPWTCDHVRWQIARWTAQVQVEHGGAIGPPPTEAEVLDALDAGVFRWLRRAPREVVALAAGLVLHDAVDELRAVRGHVADPTAMPGMPAFMVAVEVAREVSEEVARRPALAWAHDLRAQVRARDAALAGCAGRGAATALIVPRPRTFTAMVAQHGAAGAAPGALPRLALALRDAEAQAIVDARAALAERVDAEPALRQLAAIGRARRQLGLDRAQVHELARARRPRS